MAKYSMANLEAWARKSEARLEAVFKTAAQDVGEAANLPREKSGLTPVDTGFLRNSFSAGVNSIPRGESQKPRGYRQTDFDMQPLVLAVNRAVIGDRIVFGWAAEYAPYMEARYAFARSAAQRWPSIVTRAAAKVKREVQR